MVIGLIMMILACLAMMNVQIFSEDKTFLLFLFIGMMLYMIGFGFEAMSIKPLNHYQVVQRRKQINSVIYCIGGLVVLNCMIIFGL